MQFAFCFFVIYSYTIFPGILVTLGLCTVMNKKEDAAAAAAAAGDGDGDGGGNEDAIGDEKKKKKKIKNRGQRTTYKVRAKQNIDVEWVQRSLEKLAVHLEHATALTMWEDPIVTTAFVTSTIALTVVLAAYVPFKLIVLATGLYHARPPSWRVVPGPVDNLLNRMPDRVEEYTRLMEEVNRGAAASGA